jgi:glutathione S-transferase|tara:strand:- start:35 stop:694 length:660 start_codon:yes stop_codon:yes gene_type:complete
MALEVYWGSGSPYAWRVLLGLEVKKIEYESNRLSFTDEDLKSDEYLAISPRGKVPAIRDGSVTVHESIAILCYLEDLKPEPILFGNDPAERSKIWCSIMEIMNYIEPNILDYARTIFYEELSDKKQIAIRARQAIENELTILNTSLKNKKYLASDNLSAADIILYPVIPFLSRAAMKENTEEVSGDLRAIDDNYLSIGAWCKRIESIPGFEKTYPPHWK